MGPVHRARGVAFALLIGSTLGACGYSDEEMQKKNAEINDLRSALTAEQAAAKKARDELDAAQKAVDELKGDLKAKGVDMSKLDASLEDQARALEQYKRRADQLYAIKRRFDVLRQKLQALTKLGLAVTVRSNRMTIALPGDVLFDSGKETLKKDGEKILKRVGEVIRSDPGLSARTFQVAGHTDNAPLHGGPYRDNWGLSAMRAREVLVFLIAPADTGGGVNPAHWSAAGYGDSDPVKPNDTPEGRQANRRCELVVVPTADEILDLKSLTQ